MNNSINKRNLGIEILRILSMLMVIILHILNHGGILDSLTPNTLNYRVTYLLYSLAFCAVNTYALISGYVGVNSRYKFANIVNLCLRVLFYSTIITFCFYLGNNDLITNKVIIKSFFPVMMKQYWFFTSYFCLFFFIPFINNGINNMKEKETKVSVIIIIIITTIFTTCFQNDVFKLSNGYSVLWLIIMYILGACLGKFMKKDTKSFKSICCFFLTILFSWGTKILIEYLAINQIINKSYFENRNIFINYTSPTMVLASILLLKTFINFNIPEKLNKLILKISSLSFSVYLIHEHPLIRTTFIKNQFINIADKSSIKIIGYVLLISMFIYILCSVIDLIRDFIFTKIKLKQNLEKLENKIIKNLKNV